MKKLYTALGLIWFFLLISFIIDVPTSILIQFLERFLQKIFAIRAKKK